MKRAFVAIFFFTSLVGLAQESLFQSIRDGDQTVFDSLLRANPNWVSAKNEFGHSPLILATYRKQYEMAEALLQKGADPNYAFDQGMAIHGAAFKGHQNIVELLVQNGAKLNVQDANGTTPLIYATLFNHETIALYLLRNGANPEIQDDRGKSALTYAVSLDLKPLAEAFESFIKTKD